MRKIKLKPGIRTKTQEQLDHLRYSTCHAAKQVRLTAMRTNTKLRRLTEYTDQSAEEQVNEQLQESAEDVVRTTATGAGQTMHDASRLIRQRLHRDTARKTAARRTAQRNAHAAQKAATGAVQILKAAANSIKATEKGMEWVLSLGAVGLCALVLAIFLCLMGVVFSSGFGLFFETGTKTPMQALMREIEQEHEDALTKLRTDIPHDLCEITGEPADWMDVLAVYAVSVSAEEKQTGDVWYLDAQRKALIRSLYREMTIVSHTVREITVEEEKITVDAQGNIKDGTVSVKKKQLKITMMQRTARQIASQRRFTQEQLKQLDDLLRDQNHFLWSQLLPAL